MLSKKKFDAIAATTAKGKPTAKQIGMNGGLRGESHSYDHNRPMRPVVSRYSGK